ncbi:MAG: diadenylate cyclase CdaA [bacterium]
MLGYLTWVNFLDIFITFLIFYGIYLSIKGTRALQLLIGIGLFVVFMGVADWFQLRSLDLLFSKFFDVGLIFLIVVFQPEIRSGLANIGQHRFWSLFGELESEQIIGQVVQSCEKLSKREVGGLIAIEKEVGLKNYVKTGTELNSKVSSELLMSIFMSKGPLHDGAVVIQDNLVAAAGCIFPLSDRTDLPSSFGTRHRAAVGLGEESDAIIISISEETGDLTVVYRHNYHHGIDIDELEDYIYTYLNS